MGLVRILDKALRALGNQGQQDAACRLAAEAWALLEPKREPQARRLNGTLHYLTRQPVKDRTSAEAVPSGASRD